MEHRQPGRRGRPPKSQPVDASAAPQPASGGPRYSFTTDILAHLPTGAQHELTRLVGLHRAGQLPLADFLVAARPVTGERLFARLVQGLNVAPDVLARIGYAPAAPAPGTPHAQPPQSQSQQQAAPKDEAHVDASALQDVMQYAGVDLRVEQEMGAGPHRNALPSHVAAYHSAKDTRAEPESGSCSLSRLKHLVATAAGPRGVREVNEDALVLIALAATRRVADVCGRASAASKHRAAAHRSRFKIKIDNDARRVHWLLEKHWEAEQSRTTTPRVPSSISVLSPTLAANPQGPPPPQSAGQKRAAGDDVAVKTRMANVTAAAAAGVTTKSWMTASVADDAAGGQSADQGAAQETAPKAHFANAPGMTPVTDRELGAQLAQRRITLADVVFVAETDAHLAHHVALLYTLHAQLASRPDTA